MKYIPAEKLIAEIERLKGQLIRGACSAHVAMETNCKDEAYNEILSLISYLQQEQPSLPSNLDEAAQKVEDYYDVGEEHGYLYCHCGDIEDAFKAGAEWMAEQGETFNGFMSASGKRSLIAIEGSSQNFNFGKDVIVQIRKKEE